MAPRRSLGVVTAGGTVTAVLVGYGGAPTTLLEAIASLEGQTLPPQQIICVDQSEDARFSRALEGVAGVELIRPERNLGYPSACNRAAADATGEYVLFLNPDALADPECVEHLVRALAEREDAALAGAQVLLPDRDRVNAGDNVLHLTGLSWAGRYGQPPEAGPPRSAIVASGAALLVRLRAFQAIGGYTEGFFMYYDDVDLAWRARLLGWEVLFCPSANVVHDYEFTKGSYKWRWLERNRWWCLLAHLHARTLVVLAPLLVVVEMAIWARAVREGWLAAKLQAYGALWADRRSLRARRRQIQETRQVGDRAIVERMSAPVESPFLASPVVNAFSSLLVAYARAVRRLVR